MPLLVFAVVLIHHEIAQQRSQITDGLKDTVTVLSLAVDREIGAAQAVLETLAGSQYLDSGDLRAFHRLSVEAAAKRPGTRVILCGAAPNHL